MHVFIYMYTYVHAFTCKFKTQYYILYVKLLISGPSEIGTAYNRPLYKGHCLRSKIFILPVLHPSIYAITYNIIIIIIMFVVA